MYCKGASGFTKSNSGELRIALRCRRPLPQAAGDSRREMNMSGHTEGPWVVSSYRGWACVRDAKGQIIAKLVLNNPANTSLIAAAPDLLAALKNILNGISTGDVKIETAMDETWANAMYKACAAIARAEEG